MRELLFLHCVVAHLILYSFHRKIHHLMLNFRSATLFVGLFVDEVVGILVVFGVLLVELLVGSYEPNQLLRI